MFKHFYNSGLLGEFNITTERDPSQISYSVEECASIIEQAHRKVALKIDQDPSPDCFQRQFKGQFKETMLLVAALKKKEKDTKGILSAIMPQIMTLCPSKQT